MKSTRVSREKAIEALKATDVIEAFKPASSKGGSGSGKARGGGEGSGVGPDPLSDSIAIVMDITKTSRDKAIQVLKTCGGDPIVASSIIASSSKKRSSEERIMGEIARRMGGSLPQM